MASSLVNALQEHISTCTRKIALVVFVGTLPSDNLWHPGAKAHGVPPEEPRGTGRQILPTSPLCSQAKAVGRFLLCQASRLLIW